MQLEQPLTNADWNGAVPATIDLKTVALIVGVASFAASLNVPYGGLSVAAVAFFVLVVLGVACHHHGERRLRQFTDRVVDHWVERGVIIQDVSRSNGLRTGWTIQTSEGEITVGGLALTPISQLSIRWQGVGDSIALSAAETDLERLAEEWYLEIFAASA